MANDINLKLHPGDLKSHKGQFMTTECNFKTNRSKLMNTVYELAWVVHGFWGQKAQGNSFMA